MPNWLKWVITGVVALAAAGVAAWLTWWAPPAWAALKARRDPIGLLVDLGTILGWVIGIVAFPFRWWLSRRLAPSVPKTFPHDLRLPVQGFVGRTKELRELRSQGRSGGVLIYGMPGAGKTELALKLARELKRRYRDGQFDIDLLGTSPQPLTPTDSMAKVILGFHPEAKLPEGEAELRARYCSVLEGKRVLLLLDNAASAAQVISLIPPRGCALLVTSRDHLSCPELYAKNLDVLTPQDARGLLLKIAPRIGDSAAEIARLCGYLPLALRAAGNLLAVTPDLDPAGYVRELSDERQRLERIGAEGVLIGVEASFGLSYQRLPGDVAAVFRNLVVFQGSFAASAEEVVCEDPEHRCLSELVRRSLVQWGDATKRYRLHDLVRLFAESRLAEEERQAAQRRHAEHYKAVLAAADNLYLEGGYGVLRGLELYDREQVSIRGGHEWAAERAQEDRTAAQLCSSYARVAAHVLNLRLPPRDRITWLEAALGAARRLGDRHAEGRHLANLGLAYDELGETRDAIEFHEQALAIDREIGDRRGQGADLGNLGIAYAALGAARKAIEFHEQALALDRDIGDRQAEGKDLGNLGIAYANLGQIREAIEFHEQALAIDYEMGDRRGQAQQLGNLGNAYANLGETRKAIECYEQALAIHREIRDRQAEGKDLGNLGIAYVKLGKARKAIELHEQALTISREIGDRRGECADLGNLGNACFVLGETRKAIEFYEQALAISREIGDRRGEGSVLWNMSLVLDRLGQRHKAIAYAQGALPVLEQTEDPTAEKVRRQLAEWRKPD